MQRCPCCNARLKEATHCPRCKADLQNIIQAQQLAKQWYQKAIDAYLNNELQLCLDALTQSMYLQQNESAMLFKNFVTEQQKNTKRFSKLLNLVHQAKARLSLSLVKKISDRCIGIYNAKKATPFPREREQA